MRLHAAAVTHRGSDRLINQDAVAVAGWISQAPGGPALVVNTDIVDDESLACLVADGLGGHRAGEVASLMAVQRLTVNSDAMSSPGDVTKILKALSLQIAEVGSRNPDTTGMRTTIVGLIATNDHVLAFNVGDSRLFNAVDGLLYEISDGDSPVLLPGADPVAARGIVMQCLGSHNRPSPHVWPLPVDHERRYVLCSDGITNFADRATLEKSLENSADPADAAMGLLQAALDGGSVDDATVIVVDIIPGLVFGGSSGDRVGPARRDDGLGGKDVVRS